MTPKTHLITISYADTPRRVRATCLGCFGVHKRLKAGLPFGKRNRFTSFWAITHLPTGLSIASEAGLFRSHDDALAFVRELSVLRDWTNHKQEDYHSSDPDLGRKVAALRDALTIDLPPCPTPSPSRGGISPDSSLNPHALRPCWETTDHA